MEANGYKPAEFYKAAYWKFEDRHVRLTAYHERNLPDNELTALAFERARGMELAPLYMRVFFGEFLRHGVEAWYVPDELLHV